MMAITLALMALGFSAIPLTIYLANYRQYFAPPAPPDTNTAAKLSVLIPARNEASGIEACLASVLASENIELKVVVLDDHSEDNTAEIVKTIAAKNHSVRLLDSPPLPKGWNGKQHACWQLSQHASHPWLVFLDADVRLHPSALARLVAYAQTNKTDLLSAFPRQETGTLLEKMLIPLMHVILLSFLNLRSMRSTTKPAFAAGCGQLFLTNQTAYQRAGTHTAIRNSRHDGLKLPRAYRQAGLVTDVLDGNDLAACRMYRNAGEVIKGLLKNADEGIANAKLILPCSLLLIGANILPWIAVGFACSSANWYAGIIATTAIAWGWLPRCCNTLRFQQSWIGCLLHPFGILLFIILQWFAFFTSLTGKRIAWRGRTES